MEDRWSVLVKESVAFQSCNLLNTRDNKICKCGNFRTRPCKLSFGCRAYSQVLICFIFETSDLARHPKGGGQQKGEELAVSVTGEVKKVASG